MERLERIIKLLKPKYYHRITYLIVITGCSLLTKPVWLDVLNAVLQTSNRNTDKIEFVLIENWDWLIALVLIGVGLWWNIRNRLLDLKDSKSAEPEFKNISNVQFSTNLEVYQAIYPIIKDNHYIFQSVGPDSDARATESLRKDLTLWYKYRSEAVIPNNQKIKEVLLKNKRLFPESELAIAQEMITHIDAYEEHLNNPDFDYVEHWFPTEFPTIIENKCFENTIHQRSFKKKLKWISKRLKKLNVQEAFIIGSALIIADKAHDFDLVILIEKENINDQIRQIEDTKFDFKLKFKIGLHVTTFTVEERSDFNEFIEKNRVKFKLYG